MKCGHALAQRPYIPLNRPGDRERPFICRLAPGEKRLEGEWLDNADAGAHTLYWSRRGQNGFAAVPLTERAFRLDGLEDGAEYELYIESASGARLYYSAGRKVGGPVDAKLEEVAK